MFNLMPMRKTGNGRREMFRPAYPMDRLSNDFETIFSRLFPGWPVPFEGVAYPEPKWGFDVEELDKEFVVRAEAPGFEIKDFDIHVTGNVLTLRADHKVEIEKKKEGDYCYAERGLERNVTLPAGIKPEAIEAMYRNGILEVHVPKSEETKPRRVVVKS